MNPVTVVVFRKWRNGDIIALFPYEVAVGYYCNSYMHIGQHGAADYHGVLKITKPAKPEEYKDLKRELENYGPPEAHYNLKVLKRASRK